MECISELDSENSNVGGEKKKLPGDKMTKSSKIGSAQRKRLADISNVKQQPTLPRQDIKQPTNLPMMNGYVEKLEKENMTLMKLLAERNRVIELSGIEFQKLRTNLQKLQQQNLQLARENSQMLAELNLGKDRLKLLQHELGCKNAILMSRKFDLERNEKAAACQIREEGASHCDEVKVSVEQDKDNRPYRTNRRRQSKRESCGPSAVQPQPRKSEGKRPCLRRQSARFKTEEQVATEDVDEIENLDTDSSLNAACGPSAVQPQPQKSEGKRPCLRRQSARFKTEEPVATEDVVEIENFNCSSASQCKELVHEVGSTPLPSVEKEESENATHGSESQECRRPSMGRPLRRAVEKIQSYKEIPINVKMRREV